jgi:RNA polymerase sigma-70 factor (ECF subfamily)
MCGAPEDELSSAGHKSMSEGTTPALQRGGPGWPSPNQAASEDQAESRLLDPAALGGHVDRLYRAARAMCASREEAEDLVQDTFAQVLRKPRWLHSDDDVGYLLRVLKNTFVSGRRRAGRRPQASTPLDDVMWMEDPSAPRPEARLEVAWIYQEIGSLPTVFRDALIAVDLMGLSYGEASRALGVREATVTTRLHRARQRVAHALAAGEGIGPAIRPRAAPPSSVPCR